MTIRHSRTNTRLWAGDVSSGGHFFADTPMRLSSAAGQTFTRLPTPTVGYPVIRKQLSSRPVPAHLAGTLQSMVTYFPPTVDVSSVSGTGLSTRRQLSSGPMPAHWAGTPQLLVVHYLELCESSVSGTGFSTATE